jgi:hypothetical protein
MIFESTDLWKTDILGWEKLKSFENRKEKWKWVFNKWNLTLQKEDEVLLRTVRVFDLKILVGRQIILDYIEKNNWNVFKTIGSISSLLHQF